jgi:hypothetical protein
VDDAALIVAIKAGRSESYGGPFVKVLVDGQGLGSTVTASGGKVALHVEVLAPSWMELDYVRVYVNGQIVLEPVPAMGPGIARLVLDQDLALSADSILVVAAGSETWRMGAPGGGRPPVSITNPIRVDVDGNGFKPILAP